MDDASEGTGGEIQVSPEERRFLERFFRRQILPWAAVLVAISLTASWALGGDGDAALEARTAAALAQLRTENQRLRTELAQLGERLDVWEARPDPVGDDLERRVEEARQSVRLIEARIGSALEERLASIEQRLDSGAPAVAHEPGGAPPPEAAAWDVSAILDRLYALELRQQQAGPGDASVARLEDRLRRLEQRLAPAAPTP